MLGSTRERLPLHLLIAVVASGCWPGAAAAQSYRETYRSPFGVARAVSVNVADGSCWAATGASVMHVTADGTTLSQTNGFQEARSVSCNPTDGSCWVADTEHGQVVHLASDGRELGRWGGFNRPISASVNRADGSCWVACQGTYNTDTRVYEGASVAHLAADGAELWRSYAFGGPYTLSCNPTDASCWVADSYGDRVLHLAENGETLWMGAGYWQPSGIAANPGDGSCWVADTQHSRMVRLSAEGGTLWEGDGFELPGPLSVDESDGSCWIVSWGGYYETVHLATDGSELARFVGLSEPTSVSADPSDGSVWLASPWATAVGHFSADGTALWRGQGFSRLGMVAVNTADGSIWVTDYGWVSPGVTHLSPDGAQLAGISAFSSPVCVAVNTADGSVWVADFQGTVAHFNADGEELWSGSYDIPTSLAVNPNDGSCWIAVVRRPYSGAPPSRVVHLASDGTELSGNTNVSGPNSVALDLADGSCWVADATLGELLRLSPGGAELRRVGGFVTPVAVDVNQSDHSVWVADYDDWSAAHLSQSGAVLWQGGYFTYPHWVSVNSTDGSCWVASNGEGPVTLFAASGMELWRDHDFLMAGSVAVNPTDGSVWVTDTFNQQVVHLVPSRFRDVPFEHWAWTEIEACVQAGVVQGYPDGSYQPDRSVTRDQMAVYIARALVAPSGSSAIPDPEPPPSFSDVLPDHWAYKEIEYAVSQNVVEGYEDDTYRPDLAVDRGQMAVFVARAMVAPSGDAAVPDPPPSPTFPDVPSSYWSYKHIEYCVSQGVVRGFEDGYYHPADIVTRAQMAVYIYNAFGLSAP
ncbi:MAG: S-layer homology domain-containing protein [Armatimonadota bacterium]